MTLTIVDANVIIALGRVVDKFHDAAREELGAAIRRGHLGIAELTLAEVLVGPYRQNTVPDVERLLQRLGIRAISFTEGHFHDLARLRAETGLKMPDAVVLLAVIREGSDLLTFDAQLASAARRRGITTFGFAT